MSPKKSNPLKRSFDDYANACFGIFVLLAFPLLVMSGYVAYKDEYRFQHEYQLTDGRILELSQGRSRWSKTYWVKYEYTLQTMTYQNEDQVEHGLYKSLTLGQTVQVKYAPFDNTHSQIVGDEARYLDMIALPCCFGIFLFPLFFVVVYRLFYLRRFFPDPVIVSDHLSLKD